MRSICSWMAAVAVLALANASLPAATTALYLFDEELTDTEGNHYPDSGPDGLDFLWGTEGRSGAAALSTDVPGQIDDEEVRSFFAHVLCRSTG